MKKTKSILITGSHGFVGRAFQRYFSDEPADLYLIDRKHWSDCRDFFKVCSKRFDLVIHLAAIVGGRMTIEGDPLSVATDLAIDSDMFNWAVKTRQPRVVYYSSSAAYPIGLQKDPDSSLRLSESDIDASLDAIGTPDMSYGWTKLTGELLAGYARQAGVAVHVLRPFSGYGADQDLDYPFPSFVKRAAARQDPFPVWGTGRQARDFIHVDDVVRGTMSIIENDVQEPVNLCTGRSTNFLELADLVMAEAGYSAPVATHPGKPVGVMNRVGDPTFMNEFYTARTSLEEGIRLALTVR